MTYTTREIAAILKSARKAKEISQQALGEKIGVPQSHISKIENGAVDIQTSSLVEMARALDLEMMLVPRQLVPAIRAILRRSRPGSDLTSAPAYRLDEDESDG